MISQGNMQQTAGTMRRADREWPSFHGNAVPLRSDSFETGHDFVRAFHHRLCQPLTALCCSLEMLQMGREGDPKLVSQLQSAIIQSNRAMEMMGTFRQLFEAETPPSSRRSASLSPILKEVVDDLQLLAELQQVKIEVCLRGEAKAVNLSSQSLRQTLWNLIQNCVELSPCGGRVLIEVSEPRIVIFDDCGVTLEEIARLFDPFSYCANKNRASKVSNLPLALAQRIVVAAGGSIEAAWNETRALGRLFAVELPA